MRDLFGTIETRANRAKTNPARTDPAPSLYDRDFVHWTELMSAHLRKRKASELDWDNLAEEIESLGGNNRRELKSTLRVLIAHLLKWQYQPERRDGSTWKSTIREQRDEIFDLLEQSPSLRRQAGETWGQVYRRAAVLARDEMKAAKNSLPKTCPYTQDQVLDADFFPE